MFVLREVTEYPLLRGNRLCDGFILRFVYDLDSVLLTCISRDTFSHCAWETSGGGRERESGREQVRSREINKCPQDNHAFLSLSFSLFLSPFLPLSFSLSLLPPSLPPSLLSQDFFRFVFSVKQPALHALLARQHPWGNPPQQLISTHYWLDI